MEHIEGLQFLYFCFLDYGKQNNGPLPHLVWLSGLSTRLRTKGPPVQFPVRAHAWVAGQVPKSGYTRDKHTLMFLSLFLLPFPSLKINK